MRERKWKRVPSHPNHWVSTDGRVLKGKDRETAKDVCVSRENSATPVVTLREKGRKPRTATLQRIMWEAFRGTVPEKMVVARTWSGAGRPSLEDLEVCPSGNRNLKKSWSRKVEDVVSGEVWPSMVSAAEALEGTRQGLDLAGRRAGKDGVFTFKGRALRLGSRDSGPTGSTSTGGKGRTGGST